MPSGPARRWVVSTVIVVAVLLLVWIVFVLAGCGSGSTGIGAR